jgi:hypothetical protein
MKKTILVLTSLTLVIVVAVIACNSGKGPAANNVGISEMPVALSQDSLERRGKYLVTIMACNDCHSPRIMTPNGPGFDSARLLSGHPANLQLPPVDKTNAQGYALFSLSGTAMIGPWGTSFAANLTSDATGIGSWTEEQFFRAIREGKYKGLEQARTLLPPMPWEGYGKASDEDLHAIFAYLKSTPPVENRVPPPIPPGQLGKLN